MRAGKLDRIITIDAYTAGEPDEYGNSVPGWNGFATLRAQLVSMSTDEYLRAYGEISESVIVFRTRFLDGVTTTHRVGYEGRHFNIKEVKEIGRRKGLELRCEEVRS
ncbi:phage head closure protein [Consotaella salsifontis]|uniref:Phage head-tail adaptor, putative, SPP1 family n=1 Tax=Consotaella salsifontis TaxID=1365950 RepID=A0A1T4SDI2_9HYPH|nr:phage head closure protein [Consotaella salsifontis]SKA26334.1 phage head-tail adaptor, putative, SPP1 family [Consotaella salsifontis]